MSVNPGAAKRTKDQLVAGAMELEAQSDQFAQLIRDWNDDRGLGYNQAMRLVVQSLRDQAAHLRRLSEIEA